MNKTIKLGKINTLKIARETLNGFYLESLDEEEVLLPNAYISNDMDIGDIIEVFIYTDSEDRLVATTVFPKVLKNQFAFVKVVDTAPFGAFVDIGLPKDLLVPKNKQKIPFRVGETRIIRVVEDESTNRLIGVEKITSFLSTNTKHFKKNDKVDILIFAKTDLGYKAIVNNNFEGLLYNNEIFEQLKIGDKKTAYIKNIRADKKIDLVLQPIGVKNSNINEDSILELLKDNNSFLPYNYKSDAQIIKSIFKMSKKNFKKALTNLQTSKQITITDQGINLNK